MAMLGQLWRDYASVIMTEALRSDSHCINISPFLYLYIKPPTNNVFCFLFHCNCSKTPKVTVVYSLSSFLKTLTLDLLIYKIEKFYSC